MSVDRREFLKTVGIAGAAAAAGSGAVRAQPADAERRMNVLYIMTDQQPFNCVGANGNAIIQTPNLDALAARGCNFSRFYIGAFPCSPSRASQLSGRYPHNHGVLQNDVLFDADVPCLGDICTDAGYDTGYFGKWHLGGNMYREREDKRAKGLGGNWYYERSETEAGYRFKPVPGGVGEDEAQHGFATWKGGWKHYHEYLHAVGLGEFQEKNPWVGNHNDAPSGPEGTHMYSKLPEEHHMASFFAQETETFVRSHAQSDRPWCAVLSFFGPHLPVAPPKPWDEMYSLDQVELPANHRDALEGKPIRQRGASRNYMLGKWKDDQFKDYIRRYWGYCSYIDQQIGRVFTALQETGQWDSTIVVFTSDHGDMVAAHGMIFKLGACGYEELYHVPALVHIPGVTRPGSRSDALVSGVDLLPTIVEGCGMPVPEDIDGKSCVPVLKGETATHRDIIFSDCSNSSIVCRDDQYKFVLNWKSRDLDELYDLRADPGEMQNLAYEPGHEKTAERLCAACVQWARDANHKYAGLIAQQAAKKPETRILEIAATAEQFKYLGGRQFEMAIRWKVDKDVEAEGKHWAFTQFLNKRYATDGSIAFRFTPYPETPVTEWKAGQEHLIGPVKVTVPDHAGPGRYEVRTGLWDPKTHKGPGMILGGLGNAMSIGHLVIETKDGTITDIRYEPKPR